MSIREPSGHSRSGAAQASRRSRPTPARGPLALLSLQRTVGNSATTAFIQRQGVDRGRFAREVAAAQAALARRNRGAATAAYRRAAHPVAKGLAPPAGLKAPAPAINDIDVDHRLDDYGYTDALDVPKAPTNPWKWITLGRRAFSAPQTTEMVLTHELVHARQYQREWSARHAGSEQPKPGWVAWLKRRGRGFGQGPAELEAEVEVLGHLARVPARDRDQQLIRAFSALFRTVAFRPPAGRKLPLSPRDAAAAISAVYDKGAARMRAAVRRQLWRAVLEVSVTKQQLATGLRLVRRIAVAGFNQLTPALKRSFLEIPGVRDGLVRAPARQPAQRQAGAIVVARQTTAGWRPPSGVTSKHIGHGVVLETTNRSVVGRAFHGDGLHRYAQYMPSGLGTVQRDRGRRSPGIVVHPKSKLSAAEIVRRLKRNKNVPAFLKRSLRSRNGAIVIPPGRVPKRPKGTFSDFLQPFVAAMTSPDWQITTADSTIAVAGTPPDSLSFSQTVNPHLSKGQRLGTTSRTGPGETTFTPDPLVSQKKEVIFGWTVPARSTTQLKTGRGLIVVVTKITVKDARGRTKVFTPTEDEVLESIMHEISAHAGRITQGKSDVHGIRAVEDIVEDVAKFFRYSEKERKIVPYATATRIFTFVGAKPPGKPQ